MGDLISFEGRINRGTFWKYTLLLAIGYIISAFFWAGSIDSVTGEVSGGMMFIAIIIWLALFPFSVSISVRRWHDLDKSGWWMFISLVPFVGALYAFVMTGFVAGTDGPNSYGPPQGQYEVQRAAV